MAARTNFTLAKCLLEWTLFLRRTLFENKLEAARVMSRFAQRHSASREIWRRKANLGGLNWCAWGLVFWDAGVAEPGTSVVLCAG